MQMLIHQQMNIISAIVLLLFWMYACSVLERKSNINKIYLLSLSLNLILIALNVALDCIIQIDNIPLLLARITGGFVFVFSPILAYLFLQFVCNYFSIPYKIKSTIKVIFTGLILLNTIIAFFTFKSEMFTKNIAITKYALPFFISLTFLLYSSVIIYKSKKMLIKFEYGYIFAISLITSALVLFQFIASDTSYIWCSSSFVLVLMFIIIQQRELYRDSLTGARNRLVLKKYLDAHTKKPANNLSVIMIDLDYFKNINDTYGHSEGDYALKTFVRVLQKVFSDFGIVIRMGGDEFLVLTYEISTSELNDLIKKMSKMIDRFNSKGTKPYRIKYSYASGTYDNSYISIDQFIHEIDMKMYQNKKGRKKQVWSVESL